MWSDLSRKGTFQVSEFPATPGLSLHIVSWANAETLPRCLYCVSRVTNVFCEKGFRRKTECGRLQIGLLMSLLPPLRTIWARGWMGMALGRSVRVNGVFQG